MKAQSRNFDPIGAFPALEEKYLKGEMPRALLISGASRGATESFFGDYFARLLKNRVEKEKKLELFVHDPESENFKLSVLCDDLQSPPLFGGAKAIVVRRADTLCRRSATEKTPTAFEKALLHFLKRSTKSEDGILLVSFAELAPESPSITAAEEAKASVFEARKLYSSPPPWAGDDFRGLTELERWVELRARARKLSVSPEQKKQIAQLSGNELSAVENEIEKQLLLGPQAQKEILPPASSDSNATPKLLVEAILRKDLPQSLSLLDSLYKKGFVDWSGSRVSPNAMFPILSAAFVQEIRILLQLKFKLEEGEPLASALASLKVKAPEMSFLKKLKTFSRLELQNAFDSLLKIEQEIKSGRFSDSRIAFERWVVSLCAKKEEALR